jgi:CheY-like chemotaxis protein
MTPARRLTLFTLGVSAVATTACAPLTRAKAGLAATADTLAMMLKLWGHDVRTALDGREAVRVAQAFSPDIALLDIGMPGQSGYEVAREFRSNASHAGMVLVAVTGWGQAQDKRRAFEVGFDAHLTKPVDPDAVAQLLAGAAV